MRQSMKDFFKRVKMDAILSAILCIVLGVVLIAWPGETINIVCKVLAAGLIILGGVELFSYITNRNGYMFTGILGLIVLIVGVWIFLTEQYREPGTDRDRCDTCCSRCAGCENGVRIKEWRI